MVWIEEDEEKDNLFDKGDVPPNAGGCWFCHKTEPEDDMFFSLQFDAYFHQKCAEKIGLGDHPAPIGAYERGEYNDSE